MRQVPYLIIGNGRVAKHFCYYFRLINIPYHQWFRSNNSLSLNKIAKNCGRVLLLISDTAIENFIQENNILQKKILIHFSGQLTTKLAYGAHPLMTFSHSLYDLSVYQRIPFILEPGDLTFADLLPGLHNAHFVIPLQLKAFYHALCVLSGNFTCLLWQKFFSELQDTFHLPKEVGLIYLEQIFTNLRDDYRTSLTGPIVRDDKKTIAANLLALKDDPYQEVYRAFVEAHKSQSRGDKT
jgi:predicted short-subunit dehydrogenase-like oxidoreductase (DUF2520 family)